MGYRSSGATGIAYTPSTDYGSPTTGYNITPAAQPGQGAYGAVPGMIGIPPSYWEQMSNIYPVSPQATQASKIIGSQMAGELSPEEIATYQRLGAQFGAGITGGPSQFSGRQGLLSVGRKVSDVQQQGILNYEAMLKALSGTLTPQELAAQIANRNATMAAAPDPRLAAEQQMRDWMEKFQMAMNASAAQQRNYGFAPGLSFPATNYRPPTESNVPRAPGGGTYYAPQFEGPSGAYYPGTTIPNLGLDQLIDEAGIDQMMGELGYDPYGYQYGVDLPPGSYPESTYYGNTTYTQPEDWWLQGYESPGEYDMAQYPGWYEDVGYYDDFGY